MNTPKLIDVTPFEPLIIKVHYDGFNWSQLKPICEDMINLSSDNVEVENENGRSSVYNAKNQPHNNQAFQHFYNWLKPVAEYILYKEWNSYAHYNFGIGMSWVNVHNKGGVTLEHHHGAAPLVAATYLDLPDNSGFIQFKDPMEYQKGFRARKTNLDDWYTIPAKTGDVILFPGWLRHRTQPNETNLDRWVLTTNYIIANK